jgi:hypothetical protein
MNNLSEFIRNNCTSFFVGFCAGLSVRVFWESIVIFLRFIKKIFMRIKKDREDKNGMRIFMKSLQDGSWIQRDCQDKRKDDIP